MKASEVKAVVDQVTILEPINRFLHMNLEDQREIIDAIFEKTRMPIAALTVAELHGFLISHEIKARNAEDDRQRNQAPEEPPEAPASPGDRGTHDPNRGA